MKKLTTPCLLIGSPSESANLRYASGFAAVDPCVFLRSDHGNFLVVPMLEKNRARRESHANVCVLTPEELFLSKLQRRRLSGWTLGILNKIHARHVIVSSWFPVGVADRLRRKGIKVKVAKQSLFPGRITKSAREIGYIRAVQEATAAAMKAAIRMIRASKIARTGDLVFQGRKLTAAQVRAEIDSVLMANECVGTATIVAGGRQSADPHARGTGVLRSGEPIVIDIFPQSRCTGYWGDMTRTIVRGQAPAELRRMWEAVKRAQEAAIRATKSGVSASRVHRAVTKVFAEMGYVTQSRRGRPEGFIHSTGHGVGLDIHEAPSISTNPGRLRAGHVVTIEPGLYYPNIGGVRIEDLVVVTRKGCRVLASVPKMLEV